MVGVVFLLYLAAALGLGYRTFHGFRHAVGVHYYHALGVAGGSAYRLYQRRFASQEAFLVRVEYRNERHLRNIQTLSQQVYSHKDVKFAGAQVADKFHSFDGVNVVVHVAHLYLHFFKVCGEVLCHLLGEGSHEHALVLCGAGIYLRDKVLYLTEGGLYYHLRVEKPRGSDDLLHYLRGMLLFEVAGGSGNEHSLPYL